MGNRFAVRWLIGILLVAAIAGVGFYSYNLGVAQGIAEGSRIVAARGTGVPVVIWPRPWGFGFGFFPFFPFLFILFGFFALRRLLWRRGAWSGRGCGYHRRPHEEQPVQL